MVNDPYQVLGIPQGASQDEIKRAYRKKAKECHPDLHPDDPDARRKMQEVNEAYDMLMNPEKYQSRQQQNRQNSYGQGNPYGQQGGYSQGNPYGQQGGYNQGNPYGQQGNPYGQGGWYDFEDLFGFGRYGYGSQTPPPQEQMGDSEVIRRAIYYINSRQYQNALSLLNGVPGAGRNARWYYLAGIAHQGVGNMVAAAEHMQRAVQMDPNNSLYHQLLNQYRHAGQAYEQNAQGHNTMVFDPGRLCMGLCLMQFFCGFCRCC